MCSTEVRHDFFAVNSKVPFQQPGVVESMRLQLGDLIRVWLCLLKFMCYWASPRTLVSYILLNYYKDLGRQWKHSV